MTEHFWMRKLELCGSMRKPFRDSKAVQEAYAQKREQERKEEAARAAATRLRRALDCSLKARILAKVAA